jgi:hypothetical protein
MYGVGSFMTEQQNKKVIGRPDSAHAYENKSSCHELWEFYDPVEYSVTWCRAVKV